MSLMNMNVLSSFDIFLSGKIIKFDDILYHRKNTPLKLKPATKIYMKIINCLHGRCRGRGARGEPTACSLGVAPSIKMVLFFSR